MNPYFIFWIVWILAGVGVEFWALFKSHRVHGGVEGIDTLSSFTQWLVRAHSDDGDWRHWVFLAVWGFFSVWFSWHILG